MLKKIMSVKAAALVVSAGLAVAAPLADEEYVGSEVCSTCHEELGTQFSRSVHARLAPFETEGPSAGCEACHGPGGRHAESLEKMDIFGYGGATAQEISDRCLACHSGRVGMFWPASEHSMSDVSCTRCHKIHQSRPSLPREPGQLIDRAALLQSGADLPPDAASLVKPETLLCMECHRDVGARLMLPSRHPVREGKMTCSSCHQVHGSEVGMLRTAESPNALCVECHTAMQGPYLFDHQPVSESCQTCHTPHGSIADNLLKQNEPFVCLQCHEAHFHLARVGQTAPINRPTGNTSNPFGESGWRIAFGTKCTQCHQAVHGTDLPSQGVTSRGKSLTR